MEFKAQFQSKGSPDGGKFRFSGNPLAIIFVFCALFFLFLLIKTFFFLMWDQYAPYEGKVLRIEERWTDFLVQEFTILEHLIIETPEGEQIDKNVLFERRIINNIKSGDYVIKVKGFDNHVRPRDKKTSIEMRKEAEKLLENYRKN